MNAATNRFSYDPNTKNFCAEISDFGSLKVHGTSPSEAVFHQIYNDACDEGLVLASSRTGQEIKYYLAETKYSADSDRELQSWELLPCTEDVRRHPSCAGTSITVFND